MRKDHAIVLEPSYPRICQYPNFGVGTSCGRCRCKAGESVKAAPAKAPRRLKTASIPASPVSNVPVPSVAPHPTAAPRYPVTPSVFTSPENRFQWYHHTYHSAERIGQLLTERANSALTKGCSKSGHLYIFKYSDTPGLLKIGFTKNIQERMGEIRGRCKKVPEVIDDPLQRPIKHAFRAEQLVFELLHNHRMKVRACGGCNRDHIEWFAIDKAFALQVIEQVRQFMEDRYGPVSPAHTSKSPGSSQPPLRQLVEMARQLAQSEDIPPVSDDSEDIRCKRRDVVKSQDDAETDIPTRDIPCGHIVVTIRISALSSNPQEVQHVCTLERERRNMRPPETRCGDGACRLNVQVKVPTTSRQSQ